LCGGVGSVRRAGLDRKHLLRERLDMHQANHVVLHLRAELCSGGRDHDRGRLHLCCCDSCAGDDHSGPGNAGHNRGQRLLRGRMGAVRRHWVDRDHLLFLWLFLQCAL
jgi:hypothetical protein